MCPSGVKWQHRPSCLVHLRNGGKSPTSCSSFFHWQGFHRWPQTSEFLATNPQHHPSFKKVIVRGFGKDGFWRKRSIKNILFLFLYVNPLTINQQCTCVKAQTLKSGTYVENGNKPRDVTKMYISGESKSISILSECQSQHLLMRLDFPKDLHFLWLFIPRSPLFYN